MSEKTKYDVAGIGNAIVDILTYTDDAFLAKHGLIKGSMTLIDEKRAATMYKHMGAATECSGGSAANTIAGIAALGGKTAFIGKVAEDQLASIFRHDMKSLDVYFPTPPLKGGASTASCLVFVTGDERDPSKKSVKAERTMATFLGACRSISENDIEEEIIKNAQVTYCEGYLWDEENAKKAITKAINLAHKYDRKVSFSLSDAFCVERHREEFHQLIDNSIDILFANQFEIMSLFQEEDLRKIYAKVKGKCEITVVTRSEKGSVIITNDAIHEIPAQPTTVYDVTGAGDLYASGFLYGYVNGYDLPKCGKLGALAAAEVLKYLGARPLSKVSELVKLV